MNKSPSNRKKIILNNWKFNRIYIQDKELFNNYIKETDYPTNLWRSNFDFLWGSSRRERIVLWKIVDEMLVIFWLIKRKYLIMECLPFGKANAEKVVDVTYKCMKFCHNWNKKKKVQTKVLNINGLQLSFLNSCTKFQNYFISIELNGMERYASIQNLIALKGKQFENARQMINRFKSKNPTFVVRRAKKEDYSSFIDLKNNWNEKAGSKYDRIWDDYFYQRLIEHFEELNHIILIVEVEGEIVGMITGEILPHGQAWACELKYNNDFKGICEFLYVELAREINHLNQDVDLINLGTDSRGNGGLRLFKEKLRPVLNVPRYKLVLKK